VLKLDSDTAQVRGVSRISLLCIKDALIDPADKGYSVRPRPYDL
jgi:hypothetical protein